MPKINRKHNVDCITTPELPSVEKHAPSEKNIKKAFNFLTLAGQIGRFFLVSKISLFILLVSFVIPMAAFEAHVVNVTATIERRPSSCNALSIGYWRNHEGCESGGEGSSIWQNEVQALSTTLSGLFSLTAGSTMCYNLWIPNCPSGNNIPSKLCKAKAVLLADELNVVSSHLDMNAIIAGADDGSSAFDAFSLNSNSTVREALTALEALLISGTYTMGQLTDAAHVAERIYAFYEDENPQRPACIYALDEYSAILNSQSPQTSSASEPTNSSSEPEKDKKDKEEKLLPQEEPTSTSAVSETPTSTESNIQGGGEVLGASSSTEPAATEPEAPVISSSTESSSQETTPPAPTSEPEPTAPSEPTPPPAEQAPPPSEPPPSEPPPTE